jgi:hypothetical protein
MMVESSTLGVHVHASTARKFLIGIAAFLSGGTLLLFVTRDPQAGHVAGGSLAVVVFVGALFWFGYQFRVVPRPESFRGSWSSGNGRPRASTTSPTSLRSTTLCVNGSRGSPPADHSTRPVR